jgi:hypothetical protein
MSDHLLSVEDRQFRHTAGLVLNQVLAAKPLDIPFPSDKSKFAMAEDRQLELSKLALCYIGLNLPNNYILPRRDYGFCMGHFPLVDKPDSNNQRHWGEPFLMLGRDPNDFTYTVLYTLHEGGHYLHQIHVPDQKMRTYGTGGFDGAVCEGVAHCFERIGRDLEFWKAFLPIAQKQFPELAGISAEDCFYNINSTRRQDCANIEYLRLDAARQKRFLDEPEKLHFLDHAVGEVVGCQLLLIAQKKGYWQEAVSGNVTPLVNLMNESIFKKGMAATLTGVLQDITGSPQVDPTAWEEWRTQIMSQGAHAEGRCRTSSLPKNILAIGENLPNAPDKSGRQGPKHK